MIALARNSSFDVRVVNYLNAYDWLSPTTAAKILEAKLKGKIINTVGDLVKLAMMAEGGVIMELDMVVLLEPVESIINKLIASTKEGHSS